MTPLADPHSPWISTMLWPTGRRCAADAVVLLAVASWLCGVWAEEKIIFDRHAVYWNSSNPK